jgi:two-component system nitrogen regulation sensor histidine kinase GlnL
MACADLLAPAGRGLIGKRMADVFGDDAPIVDLARRALKNEQRLSESDVLIEGPGFVVGRADLWAAPIEDDRFAALALAPRARTRSGSEARPVSAVAKTLAHEVRNPLAGIRAAAQLIPKSTHEEILPLADLIIEEVDRIRRLTDRIGALEGLAPPKFGLVNVHEALERVRRIIASTFPTLILKERYDPSLPTIRADMDQLIQAFLNIAKNAAEAAKSKDDGAITLATQYRPGVRIRSALGGARAIGSHDRGQRPRHSGGDASAAVRAVRHHQGRRHGVGFGGVGGNRRAPRWAHRVRERAWTDGVSLIAAD